MRFQDIELHCEDEIFIVPANKVMKLFREVAVMIKVEHFANVESLILDQPFIFSDAYHKALSHGKSLEGGTYQGTSDDVLFWMSNDNYQEVLEPLMKIKMLFQQPEKIQKKVGSTGKKKKTTVKK